MLKSQFSLTKPNHSTFHLFSHVIISTYSIQSTSIENLQFQSCFIKKKKKKTLKSTLTRERSSKRIFILFFSIHFLRLELFISSAWSRIRAETLCTSIWQMNENRCYPILFILHDEMRTTRSASFLVSGSVSYLDRLWKVWWRGAWLVGVSVAGYSGVAEWLPAGHGLRDVHGNPLPVLYRDDISPSQRVSSRCHWLSHIANNFY